MTELSVVPDPPAITGRAGVVAVHKVGIELAEDIRFNDWRNVLAAALAMSDGAVWIVADCVAFGLKKLKHDPAWLIYRTMIEAKYAQQSLYNLGSVARKVEISRRRENLTFTHHAEVSGLEPDEQTAWLDDAITHNWSTRELREEIQRFRETGKTPSPALSVRIVEDYFRIATVAAERRGMDPKDWVLEAIREKATRESPGLEVA